MQICLFEDHSHKQLLPLTYTRPLSDLRIGISTIKQKWQHLLKQNVHVITQEYLQKDIIPSNGSVYYINSSLIPNELLIEAILSLNEGESLHYGNKLIAYNSEQALKTIEPDKIIKGKTWNESCILIQRPWDLFFYNDQVLKSDFTYLTKGRNSASLSNTNLLIGDDLFIEEGASIEGSSINTLNGPVYIGKNTEVMEGSLIRGGLSLCENSTLKMGTKIYGPTTIGPYCKIGGEVSNSVFLGYTNKGHDGFIGNSVIGHWCNLGADTNTSNLKNNYAEVRLWDYTKEGFTNTGLQFCGLIMGDHSKCGINTMFNTGTVVGICANIFGEGFPRNFIPSFSWGGKQGFMTYKFEKVMEVAEIVMKRRNITLGQEEKNILQNVFDQTAPYRSWEK